VRILLETLGQDFETFSNQFKSTMETKAQTSNRNLMLIAVVAGGIYLVVEIILGAMDIAWLYKEQPWESWMNQIYISLSLLTIVSFALFMRGFIALASIFGNSLLKIAGYGMILMVIGSGILDILTITTEDEESLWLTY